jgi:hypothetical protein
MFKCELCDKEFKFKVYLERHKDNKNPCVKSKDLNNCKLCNMKFPSNSQLKRHEKTTKHITNNNIHIENLNQYNITNNYNIDIHITKVNSFIETNLDFLKFEEINRLLNYENEIENFIKEMKADPDDMYGSTQYNIMIFKFFIKVFTKLNFNLSYTENHNCAIFSFYKTFNNFIEYHLLEIDINTNKYVTKCIKFELFLEKFLILLMKINDRFNIEKFDFILKYVIRYKKSLFTSENFKITIEKELLDAYTKFEESKNTKETEDEEFRVALLTARRNAFKHITDNQ